MSRIISEDDAFVEVVWRIEDFNYDWYQPGKCFQTDSVLQYASSDWYLRLYPKGTSLSSSEWIIVTLYRGYRVEQSQKYAVSIKTEFSVLDSDNKPRFLKQCENELDAGCQKRIEKFVTAEYLFRNRDTLLPKNYLTLRCRITYKGLSHSQHVFARTPKFVLQRSIIWPIENFEVAAQSSISVTYPVCENIISQPVKLTVAYQNKEGIEWIKFKIKKLFEDHLMFKGLITVNIEDQLRSYVLSEKKLIYERNFEWLVKPLLTQNYILERVEQSSKVTLQATCDFIIRTVKLVNITELGEPFIKIRNENSRPLKPKLLTTMENFDFLKADLQRMYKNGTFSDLCLQVESDTFNVHACVLATRSPVFNSMLESDMQEKTSRIIVIKDLDSETCSRMLDYFYSADLGELDVPMACKLYYAGDKYQVPGLKISSSNFLKCNLEPDNVFEVLLLADRHQDKDLKDFVIDYICKQKQRFPKEKWCSFMEQNVQLAASITFKMFQTK